MPMKSRESHLRWGWSRGREEGEAKSCRWEPASLPPARKFLFAQGQHFFSLVIWCWCFCLQCEARQGQEGGEPWWGLTPVEATTWETLNLLYVGSQPFGDCLISPMRVHQWSTSLIEHLKDEKDTEVWLDRMHNREIAASQEASSLKKQWWRELEKIRNKGAHVALQKSERADSMRQYVISVLILLIPFMHSVDKLNYLAFDTRQNRYGRVILCCLFVNRMDQRPSRKRWSWISGCLTHFLARFTF